MFYDTIERTSYLNTGSYQNLTTSEKNQNIRKNQRSSTRRNTKYIPKKHKVLGRGLDKVARRVHR